MRNYKILDNSNSAKRKNPWIKRLIILFAILVLIVGIVFLTKHLIKRYNDSHITISKIQKVWKTYDYQQIYQISKEYLQNDPYNNTALTYYSYACFFLSQSQTDTQSSQQFLDECINNLRIALYSANKNLSPQLLYMLGRAYFYKNTITTHYYADLAIQYLLQAKQEGYEADDIPELLGLSYASLGMAKESISAFTEALLIRESDSLLLSIAEQYSKLEEYNAAKQYLYRVIKNSSDEEIVIKSKNHLANIYLIEEDYASAEKEFREILEINSNSGDAHYGLGLIYEHQGNMVAARSEWRTARKVQVNHAGALQKLKQN